MTKHFSETGQESIEHLIARLSPLPSLSYRIVLVQPPTGSQLLHTLLVDALPANAHGSREEPFSYHYRDVHALGGQISGVDIANFLQRGKKMVTLADPVDSTVSYTFGMPPLVDPQAAGGLAWYRFPSRSRESIAPLLWPHTRYAPFIQDTLSYLGNQIPRHLLINEGEH